MPSPASPDSGSKPPSDPLVSVDFGQWCRRVLNSSRRGLARLLLVQLIAQALASGCTAVVKPLRAASLDPSWTGPSTRVLDAASSVLYMAITSCAVVASVVLMIRVAAGQPSGVRLLVRIMIRRTLPLTFWLGVAGSGYLLLVWLTAIGGSDPLYLAVGVFLYLYVVFGASLVGVIVVERRFWPLGRCFALIRHRFWATTGRLLLAHLAFMLYWAVTSYLPVDRLGPLLGGLTLIPINIVGTAVVLVSYAELRARSDPTTTTRTLDAELTSGTQPS
ncbi:hypothetical protein [Pseudonocardia spinosispora]|uniref:hypothetical protein n=1 Tax=Pseudonocardia spinosispora TaxID=103441 RepID=UPI000406C756|nr:hypothetical protein [Pseudonocardia spinosispora]